MHHGHMAVMTLVTKPWSKF